MTSPCMIRRDLEGNYHLCLDISQIPTGLMAFLLHIANRRHFCFPLCWEPQEGLRSRMTPVVEQLNGVPVVWVLRGRDAQLRGGWV